MSEEQYKHSQQTPGGHVVDLKMREDKKQSYLTKSDLDYIGKTIGAFFMFGLSGATLGVGLISDLYTLESWNLVGMLFIAVAFFKSLYDSQKCIRCIDEWGDQL